MMKITKRILQANGACKEHVMIFTKRWPKGINITSESLNEARAIGLDIFWLESLIPADKWPVYKAQKCQFRTNM